MFYEREKDGTKGKLRQMSKGWIIYLQWWKDGFCTLSFNDGSGISMFTKQPAVSFNENSVEFYSYGGPDDKICFNGTFKKVCLMLYFMVMCAGFELEVLSLSQSDDRSTGSFQLV